MPRGKNELYESQAHRVQAFREAFVDGVSAQDIQELVQSLVARAKAGDVRAAALVLERCVGAGQVADWRDRRTFDADRAKAREWDALSPDEKRTRKLLESIDSLGL